MSSPDPVSAIDARIAELRKTIDTSRQVIDRATADIKVLEQAKEVFTRSAVIAPSPAHSAASVSSDEAKGFGLRHPAVSAAAWREVAYGLLEDGNAHTVADIYYAVANSGHGKTVGYTAVASWLARCRTQGLLEKDGHGRYRMPSPANDNVVEEDTDDPLLAEAVREAREAEERDEDSANYKAHQRALRKEP